MTFSLVVRSTGKLEGQKLEIKLAQFLIGRDPQCHLRPASPLISKRHCVLTQRDGKAFIRDFDSTNGSFINDQPVEGEAELHNGDSLKIGPLLFEVQLDSAPASVNRPTPPPPTRAAQPTKTAPAGQTPAPPAAKKPAPAAAAPGAKKPAAPGTPEGQKPAAPQRPAASDDSSGAGSEDEDIAALLLDQDEGTIATPLGASSVEVPEGSTVHEMVVPPEVTDTLNKTAQKKDQDKKSSGNTASAAKSILEMYMKRPRT